MKRKTFKLIIIVFIYGIFNAISYGFWDWKAMESDNFVMFYPDGYEKKAQESIYYLERYRSWVTELTGNEFNGKIQVSLEDIGLYTNGYADPINNKIGIFTNNPGSDSRLNNYENWLRFVNVHELVHIGQFNNTSGITTFNTRLFGNLLSPNIHTPLWLIEGMAVYAESQISPYEGRLNGSYFDGVLSLRASEGKMPSLSEISYNHKHFPGGQHYLYGSTFFRYLANEYGEKKFGELFTKQGSYFWAPFHGNIFPSIGIDKAAKEVYGKNFQQLYLEWQEYEMILNKDWKIDGEKIIATDGGHISNLTPNGDKIYYFKYISRSSYPLAYSGKAQLIEYDLFEDTEKVLVETIGNNFGTIQIKDDEIYYMLGEVQSGYVNESSATNGFVGNIYRYNLNNESIEKILSDEIKDFAVLEDGRIIYSVANKAEYGSVIFAYQDGVIEKIGKVSQLISEMKPYKDDLVVVSKANLGSWGINRMNIENLNIEPIINTNWAEKQINIIDDNLYFTANYEGYEAIYQYNLNSKQALKITDGGYASGGFLTENGVYFLVYDIEGMAIYRNSGEGEEYKLPDLVADQKSTVDDFEKIGVELKEINSFKKNLSYLLKPSMKLFPHFLAGKDSLGLNSYQIEYSQPFGLDFVWTNRFFDPLTITYANRKKEDGRSNGLSLRYPIYQSSLDGVTNISIDLSTDFDSVLVGNSLGLKYPNYNIATYAQLEINSLDHKGQMGYRYFLTKSSLGAQMGYYNGLNKAQDVREFPLKQAKSNGVQFSLDYTHRLFKVRKGFWNPNIFLGDIYGKVFTDYLNFEDDNILSGGYELMFENGAAFWLHFVPSIGVKIKQDETKPYFGFDARF